MIMTADKQQEARQLSESHAQAEQGILRILVITSPMDPEDQEPIKLLEVNTDTVATGIVPVTFAASGSIRHKSVVVEVTPEEFESIQTGQLQLPQGWKIGDILFQRG